MPNPATVAFGRYLRELRERRGVTLRGACEMSVDTAFDIDKATLSRLERGHQGPGLSTLIQLGRVYGVPVEVLADRFELDAELERIGRPDLEGLKRHELARSGRRALLADNDKWTAYACYRSAFERASLDAIDPRLADAGQQREVARLDLATVARSLGKNRYALFEYQEIERSGRLPEAWHPVLFDRLANCYRCLGYAGLAERHVERAVGGALALNDRRALSYAYQSLAIQAIGELAPADAIEPLKRAFRASREADGASGTSVLVRNPGLEAEILVQLADAYCDQESYDKAAQAGLAARRLAVARQLPGATALSDLFLGRVEEATGRPDRALHRWRDVVRAARALHDHRLDFMAEFHIFRQARRQGQRGLAEASRRRLERLASWVRSSLPQLVEFRELTGGVGGNPSSAARRRPVERPAMRGRPGRGPGRGPSKPPST